jgi:hypothetical protein
MYVDSSPVTTRRPARSPRLRPARRGTHQTAGGRARPAPSAAARRTRLADAIVSQWLLEQVPSEHRHALGGASQPARELSV